MFPADISARRYKKSAVINCTPFAYGLQGVSGKGYGGGGGGGRGECREDKGSCYDIFYPVYINVVCVPK